MVQGGGLGFTKKLRVRSLLHFHPTLDLCAFAYPDQGVEDDDGEGADAIMRGTDAVACRDVEGFDDGGPLKEGEVSFWGGLDLIRS